MVEGKDKGNNVALKSQKYTSRGQNKQRQVVGQPLPAQVPSILSMAYLPLRTGGDALIEIVGWSNGLVCVHNKSHQEIPLWNPSIQRFKKIPSPTIEEEPDLWTSSHYGSGYDSSDDDYNF